MQHSPVTGHDSFFNVLRFIGIGVDDATILEVDAGSEMDRREIPADHAPVPDVDTWLELHVADDDRARGDVKPLDGLHSMPLFVWCAAHAKSPSPQSFISQPSFLGLPISSLGSDLSHVCLRTIRLTARGSVAHGCRPFLLHEVGEMNRIL